MNKYRILTAALSSKATVDDFTFCRSSDLLLFTCLPTLLYIPKIRNYHPIHD